MSIVATPATADRYVAPGSFTRRVFNPTVAWLTRRGLSLKGSAVLEVVGRSTGEVRSTPVNPLCLDGVTYLVAPRGVTQWVRNIRVAGAGTLVRGRRRVDIVVDEVADDDKPEILRAYLRAWAWEVGALFPGLSSASTDAELRAAAAGFPVFRVR